MIDTLFYAWLIGATFMAFYFGWSQPERKYTSTDTVWILGTILCWFFILMIVVGQGVGNLRFSRRQ